MGIVCHSRLDSPRRSAPAEPGLGIQYLLLPPLDVLFEHLINCRFVGFMPLSSFIREEASRLGFAAVGFATVGPCHTYARFTNWLSRGYAAGLT